MKLTSTFLFRAVCAAFLLLLTTPQVSAQDSCTFRLSCYDNFGDGWDDSRVLIRSGNGTERSYTNNVRSTTSTTVFFDVRVRTGDSIWVRYEAQGIYQDEIEYALLDNTGVTLFSAGPNPFEGIVYRSVARCRNCGAPIALTVPDIRTTNATARWRPAEKGFQSTYLVQWDTAGFTYGRGRNRLTTTDTFAVITGLTEFVKYDVYVRNVCFGNDSSLVTGPATFVTDTATDLSVVRILGPGTSCALSVDSIKILIKNIGGVPQQLFQYKASVNGVNLPISVPADGLFTGVLSKDSTVVLAFRNLYDFSPIGEYVIKAWTEVSNDKNRKNDTATLTVVHPRTIGTYPYFQNFELGKDTWFVTDSIGNSTWEYGQPRGTVINSAASGTRAWTTWADSTYRLNEFAYVNSPCLNFTSLTADPRISLNINVNTEASFDGSWMESSVDNGLTWQLVGGRRINGGLNWYNDSISAIARPTWGGTADSIRGWRLAQNILRGTAGRSNVRLRIGFRSDFSGVADGFAFDNVLISPVPTVDLASSSPVSNLSVSSCSDSVINTLIFRVANVGTTAQRNYSLNYQVNGGATVTETLDSLLAPNQTLTYRSLKPFKTTAIGNYTVKSWINVAGDQQVLNDSITTLLRITTEKPLLVNTFPYFQNFENGSGTWSATDSINGTWGLITPTGSPINTAASGTKAFKVGATTVDNTYNNNEWSYLLSPCFDFTSLTADPRISFALNIHSQALSDGGWLEGSTNGGTTWTRIGTRNTGVNWYNDSISAIARGVWGGVTNLGWKPTQNTLTGFGGKPNCRFRFVFRSSAATNTTGGLPYGGIAVDDIFIGAEATVDLAAAGANRLDITTCGRATDTVAMNITNLGTVRQFRFNTNYRIDNQAVVTELIDSTLNILPRQTVTYKFRTPFNSTAFGNHTITTWVSAVGDATITNDTLRTTYIIPPPISTFTSYNFDDNVAPPYWTVAPAGGVVLAIGAHGNAPTNGNAYANIWSSNRNVQLTTHRFGPVRNAKDSISFDYRFVNELTPTTPYIFTEANKDTFNLQVAYDCEDVFVNLDTITIANHIPTIAYQTHKFSLGRFANRTVRFRFRMVSSITATFGYFVDVDNINYLTCPESFNVQASIRNSRVGATLGSVALTPPTAGLAPFIYSWSNGRTTDSIGGLAAGTYTVSITDGRGCTQTGVYTVQNTVGTFDVSSIFNKVTLAPNPTTGNTTLNLELTRPTLARIQVLNVMGQLLYETRSQTTEQQQQYELDMTNRPAGIYLVRIVADNRSFTTKLVKQ